MNGHVDRYLLWHQLSMEHNMNVICDSLVKTAVSRATRLGMQHDAEQRLPSEDTAIFANNKKLTKDLGKAMMYNVEKEQAQRNQR